MSQSFVEKRFGRVRSDWPCVQLSSVAFFQEGPGLRKWQWTDAGMKVINGTNVLANGDFDVSNTNRFIALDEFKTRYSHFAVEPDDIVVVSSGSIGKVSRVRAEHLPLMMNTSVIRFQSADKTKLDGDYLYAYLRSPLFQNQATAFAIGSAQLNFGPVHIKQMELPLPPLSAQRMIAAILAAYDDLIDNNNRRIRILEEMAQRIYREWFVDFRYPGHEDVPLVDSDLGQIPDGWDFSPVGTVTAVFGGGTPSKGILEYWEPGTVTWFTPTDLTRASAMFVSRSATCISEQGLVNSSAKLFPPGAVMMTSRATIGVVAITTVPAATNQGFITCLPTESVGTYHLYFWLIDQRDVITALASGATFKEINKRTFRDLPFLKAPSEIERQFEECLEPIASQVLKLLRMQRTLRRTRDLLIPRLISGDVDVAELDIAVRGIAA